MTTALRHSPVGAAVSRAVGARGILPGRPAWGVHLHGRLTQRRWGGRGGLWRERPQKACLQLTCCAQHALALRLPPWERQRCLAQRKPYAVTPGCSGTARRLLVRPVPRPGGGGHPRGPLLHPATGGQLEAGVLGATRPGSPGSSSAARLQSVLPVHPCLGAAPRICCKVFIFRVPSLSQ